jgi:DNA mismatch repair protein MutL
MSDIIRLLPDSVANQIAAGEVIQRPASVIKELVENSLDAGATHIDVIVVDAGKTSIQVVDDGKGMSETDARLSFERHATSKIREASDLFALRTMGFRGEALASIAAVAQVELYTRQASEELGTALCISGSKVESQEVTSCPVGCNFIVKNLFFNIPARRKFLKSNQTELSNILAEFERIVLVHPEVSFTLHHNETELFNLPNTTFRQRLVDVFGRKLNQQLLTVEVDTTMIKISGVVGTPESSRKKGAHQYFFVNGRYMRHPYFHKAVMDAYERLIPVGEQVSYFLCLEIDPANIDVNIHPTKTEIKFDNEQAIWQIIAAAVKESLGKFNAIPSIDFDTEGMLEMPAYEEKGGEAAPSAGYNPNFNPFTSSETTTYRSRLSSDWGAGDDRRSENSFASGGSYTSKASFQSGASGGAYQSGVPGDAFQSGASGSMSQSGATGGAFQSGVSGTSGDPDFFPQETNGSMEGIPFAGGASGGFVSAASFQSAASTPENASAVNGEGEEEPLLFDPSAMPHPQEMELPGTAQAVPSQLNQKQPMVETASRHYQFKGRYILTSLKSGLVIIDQQRAHVRVLFDRFLSQIEAKQGISQGVLFPEIVQFPPSEAVIVEEITDELTAVGFDLSNLGGGSYAINGIPSGTEGLNAPELLRNMVHTALEKGNDVKQEIQEIVALSLAKASAIVPGQLLSNEEMNNLVESLFLCPTPNYTPDGKIVLSVLSEAEIEKLF